jgi:nitronate monooxygenase
MRSTRFTELTCCRYPIQLAGMPGVCTLELASAVSNAGGLGMISATHVSPTYLSEILDELKKLTNGVFGVNFLMPFLDIEYVKVTASKSRVVEFFYGDPDPALITTVHREGALASWQVGSVAEAIAAARAGCDFIVAQGTQAGGHVRGGIGAH